MIALLAVALAGGTAPKESNVSVTSVGAQFWQSAAVGKQDIDVLLEQRLRWTLMQNENMAIRLRADGRFTLDVDNDDPRPPIEPVFFERNRVKQLGASIITNGWTLDIGRARVHKGGPRLVDGVQFLARPSTTFEIGAWAGLAPDTFTTEFRTNRFGGGPIIAYAASRVQASLVGDFLISGGLDRAAVLAQVRASAARTIEVAGRLDMDLASNYGPHLQDSQVFARWAPVDSARIDVFWDGFSSYLYRNTENLDPDITRFGLRMRDQDLRLDAVLQNCLEPKVAHAIGTNFLLQPRSDGTAPHVSLKGRYRFGGKEDLVLNDGVVAPKCGFDDINTFLRVNPTVGLVGLPIAGRLDVKLDGNFFTIDGKTQYDAGVLLFWEPSDEGVFAFDTSYRLLINPYDAAKNPLGYQGVGHYTDVFVDLVVPSADLMLGTGLNVVSEPGVIVDDLSVGAYARVTKYLRKRQKAE
ncbi:MAG: hypothetical protein H6737_18385 [Alphaproteobacteria bacterium]|nr:hypothetical protein [Alphaproteobacteria bacterium]